jgi:hypothetical protein
MPEMVYSSDGRQDGEGSTLASSDALSFTILYTSGKKFPTAIAVTDFPKVSPQRSLNHKCPLSNGNDRGWSEDCGDPQKPGLTCHGHDRINRAGFPRG